MIVKWNFCPITCLYEKRRKEKRICNENNEVVSQKVIKCTCTCIQLYAHATDRPLTQKKTSKLF